jgi:pilus assembly protein CpaB
MLTVVMFGIVGLLVVAYFAKNLFAQKEKPQVPQMRDVPMAVTDIKPGTIITADHLGVGRYERNKLAADVLLANRVIVGRVAKEPIKPATPIKAGQLYQPGELPPLDIGPGMRAMSIEVGDGVAMVDGIIKPGDTVDVLFTAQGGGNGGVADTFEGGVTMRLFEGVKVLAINRNFSQGRVDRANNHVTLELTVPQTNILVLAKDKGKINLTYNPNGKGNGGLALTNPERVTLFELLGLEKAEPLKELFLTELFKGNTRTSHRYDSRGRRYGVDFQQQAPADPAPRYQLPNSTVSSPTPNPGGNNSSGPQTYNDTPQLNTVPGRPIHQAIPKDDQPARRNAPTAQVAQPRTEF